MEKMKLNNDLTYKTSILSKVDKLDSNQGVELLKGLNNDELQYIVDHIDKKISSITYFK